MSRAFRWLIVGLGCLAIIALISGHGPWLWSTFSAEETYYETFSTGAKPSVIIDTFNGPIEVHTGLTGTVSATVTKKGSGFSQDDADTDLENIDVQFAQEGDTIRITARRIDGHWGGGATVKVDVPPGAIVDLHTSNGTIETHGPTGDVAARSSNGQIKVAGTTGTIRAQTSNGGIRIDADSPRVEAKTSNGRIEYAGRLGNQDHRFQTSNGRIVVQLPADSRFQFDARTSHGKIVTKFPTKEKLRTKSKHQTGTVGDNPSCRLTLHTSNGTIQIGKLNEDAVDDEDDDD